MPNASSQAIDQLLLSIESQELVLPTLPHVARKIQHMIDDINFSADQLVAAISGDPAISAQVIKTANGPPFDDRPRVDNVKAAAARLGYRPLRKLLTGVIEISGRTQASHPVVVRHLHDFWEHSRDVATYSFMLAKNLKILNPDQAMLAGLLHDIGTLPLCLHAEFAVPHLSHETLNKFIWDFRSAISKNLLHAWNFPAEIIDAATGHEKSHRPGNEGQASCADIIAVANLLDRTSTKSTAWENIAAVEKLRLSPAVCRIFHDQFQDEIRATRELLFPQLPITATRPA